MLDRYQAIPVKNAPTKNAPTSALTTHAMLVNVATRPTVTWPRPPNHWGQCVAKVLFNAGTAAALILTQNDGRYPAHRRRL
jgi:hypothetical protein